MTEPAIEPAAAPRLVELRNVDKVFRRGSEEIHVLGGLDLEIPEGEFLALMGPSGSGKSTLLNLIGGLDRPSQGSVVVGGKRIDQLSNRRLAAWRARHVGLVFQFYNLMPMLSAEKNVELPLLLTRLARSERRKRAGIALDIVGLSHRRDHSPRTLSGGEQQRVGIARDEILDLLQALNREQGKTIIMVTHDLHAAARASRTLYLNKGRLSTEPEDLAP
jgi:putative ABC transport system ATP-binding protein